MAVRATLLHPPPPPADPARLTELLRRALRGATLTEAQTIHLPGLAPLLVERVDGGGPIGADDEIDVLYPTDRQGPPWDVVFLVDGSATMGRRIHGRRRLEEAAHAIHACILNAAASIEQAALVVHATAPLEVDPPAPPDKLEPYRLFGVKPRGGVDARAALAMSVALLEKGYAPGRAIVVLTDTVELWLGHRAQAPVRRAGAHLVTHPVLPAQGEPGRPRATLEALGIRTDHWMAPPPPPPPGTPFAVVLERKAREGLQR